tara:strand:- start:237 stop:500 length:264 start_codon:yes stop_codon:yes gene_type:complete
MTIVTQKDKRDYYSEQDKPKQLENMKAFTIEQVGTIFQIERFLTLTPMFYKNEEYQFQFDFNDETYNTMNIIKMKTQKVVGYFNLNN